LVQPEIEDALGKQGIALRPLVAEYWTQPMHEEIPQSREVVQASGLKLN
jgi:hypothetical protein